MSRIASLLGRTLVLVAHPDDEAVACAALLQRVREPIVVFATDGAPRDAYFWQKYGSRERYADLRAQEAGQALQVIDIRRWHFVETEYGRITDQELFRHLPAAFLALQEFVKREQPQALLTLAYEGGHPDHDSCNFLVSQLANEFHLLAWEMPLYQRASGELRRQVFIELQGTELLLPATPRELERKRQMLSAYASQWGMVREFAPAVEQLRPLAVYDYSRPPHAGVLNYEAWQWPVTGAQLCEAFATFAAAAQTRTNSREGESAA